MEENNEENVEAEEEPEEEQEEEEDTSSTEEEEEADDDELDPWSLLRQKVGEDLQEPYLKEVQQFLYRGKSQAYAEDAAFNAPLLVTRRRLRKNYLECLKWSHRIKPIVKDGMKTTRNGSSGAREPMFKITTNT